MNCIDEGIPVCALWEGGEREVQEGGVTGEVQGRRRWESQADEGGIWESNDGE